MRVKVNTSDPFVHRALPDNSPELIFYCQGKLSIQSPHGDEGHTFPSGMFGQTKIFRRFSCDHHFSLFGVHLYPYSLRILFDLPADEIANQKIDSTTLWGIEGKELEEQIGLASCNVQRVRIVSDFLMKRISLMRDNEYNFAHQIKAAIDQTSLRSPAAFAHDCNLSRRQFERKFKEFAGLSPREFLTVNRFKKVMTEINQGKKSLAQIAVDTGYYDQSHLTNEFRNLSGYTPKVFLQQYERNVDQRATRDFRR